jgi:chromosome segregation ATPase
MEEIKKLYKKLQDVSDEQERLELWGEILKKNRILLKKRRAKIDEHLEDRIGDLRHLTDDLGKLKDVIKTLKKDPEEKNV